MPLARQAPMIVNAADEQQASAADEQQASQTGNNHMPSATVPQAPTNANAAAYPHTSPEGMTEMKQGTKRMKERNE